jgi:tRNA A37 methylthiotransferase MiaB
VEAAGLNEDGKKRKIVITGCLAQRYSEQLAADLPEADLVMGFQNYGNLPASLGQAMGVAVAAPPPAQQQEGEQQQQGEQPSTSSRVQVCGTLAACMCVLACMHACMHDALANRPRVVHRLVWRLRWRLHC